MNDKAADPTTDSTVTVGIAVVEHDGRYLIGIRGNDGPLPGLAEFPGGKCHVDETPRDCAIRECREETGLHVEPIELLWNKQHQYEHARVDLHFWRCRAENPNDEVAQQNGFRWIPRSELPALQFPEANAELIATLSQAQ